MREAGPDALRILPVLFLALPLPQELQNGKEIRYAKVAPGAAYLAAAK
ncbi:MAG: hypothetical protein R3E31_14385 [Chloroflexota bacterium]